MAMHSSSIPLFERCKLEGDALNAEVSRLEGSTHVHDYCGSWALGGPIIERDHIHVEPPSQVLAYTDGGCEMIEFPHWRAVVPLTTRGYPNSHFPEIMNVGRGLGLTPLVAAMRAYVDSFSTYVPAPPAAEDPENPFK